MAADALEAVIRPIRASAATPPPLLRCALARTPNNPCDREATTPTRPSGCKLDGSAAIQQKRYDARWGKRTMSKEFLTFQLAPPVPTAVLGQPAGVGALTAVSSLRWKHGILTNHPCYLFGGVNGLRLPHSMAKAKLRCGIHDRDPAGHPSACQTAHKG